MKVYVCVFDSSGVIVKIESVGFCHMLRQKGVLLLLCESEWTGGSDEARFAVELVLGFDGGDHGVFFYQWLGLAINRLKGVWHGG